MKKYRFTLRSFALGGLITALAAGPAHAATVTPVDTSFCSNPLLSQPFLSAGDTNLYTLMPGQTPGNFNGAGWTLTGGAKIVTTPLAAGSTRSVLDLPSGSRAVSPTICVASNYPTERAEVRNVVGAEGIFMYVSYEGTNTWNHPQNTGQMHGEHNDWSLATPVNIQPSHVAGWQPMRITLIPGGKSSDFQLYNLYIDPHARF